MDLPAIYVIARVFFYSFYFNTPSDTSGNHMEDFVAANTKPL